MQINGDKKIVAIIPARGSSKRIHRKNIRILGGHPLIAWTIKAALASKFISRTIVSTDDTEIAKIAEDYGAEVPWLRPPNLATDSATSFSVIKHAMDEFDRKHELSDAVVMLQPTSPFRSCQDIDEAITLFRKDPDRPVIGCSEISATLEWCFIENKDFYAPVLGWDSLQTQSQNIKKVIQINGSIYIASTTSLKMFETFLQSNFKPFISNYARLSIDIDDEEDWSRAEEFLVTK